MKRGALVARVELRVAKVPNLGVKSVSEWIDRETPSPT
jgi:hypothetical protein